MSDDDYILDITGLGGEGSSDRPAKPPGEQTDATGRSFISVHFECCNIYQRVYRNAAGTAYVGWCPKCARKIVARISPDGIDARFFRAQ